MSDKKIVALCFFSLLLSCSCSRQHEKGEHNEKPNVLVIVADDLGWSDLACYGNNFIETPRLDAMAADGIKFTNAYAAASLCSPSRAGLITGMHPVRVNITEHIHGPFRPNPGLKLITPNIDQQLKLSFETCGELFSQEGFNTAYIGKWHLGGGDFGPENQGFDFIFAANYHGLPKSFHYPFFRPGTMPDIESRASQGDYLTDVLTDQAIDYIENNQSKFFMFLSFYSPHVPIEGKDELVSKYLQKRERNPQDSLPNPHYAAMVASIDQNVGRILDKLEKLNILENTLIIFTSDNGGLSVREVPAFAKHTPPTDNFPLRKGKGYIYEGGLRVPLIIQWPVRYRESMVVDAPVVGTDLYNSFVEISNRNGKTPDGESIFSTIDTSPRPDRSIYWHIPHYSPQGGKPASALRKGKYKLIQFYEDERIQLYDLENDMKEENDLSTIKPDIAAGLLEELNSWKAKMGAGLPVHNPDYEGI